MKQLVLVALIVVSLGAVFALPAASQTPTPSGSIDVEISPQVTVSLTLTGTEVQFSNLALSRNDTDRTNSSSQFLQVTNSGNVPVNLFIKGENATSTSGNVWSLSCNPPEQGTVGADQYVLKSMVGTLGQALCPDQDRTLASDVQSDQTIDYRLILSMPTSTSDFSVHRTSVTITAVQ